MRPAFLGAEQMRWLMRELAASRATWKVIASDMPIGIIVWNNGTDKTGAEAVANGEQGVPKGRELEFAELLRFIKNAGISNVVWLTADVHYTVGAITTTRTRRSSRTSRPSGSSFRGPLHAGTFGPGETRHDLWPGSEIS